MTREEWEADLVDRSLSGRWPEGKSDRIILERGPCQYCNELMEQVERSDVDSRTTLKIPVAACPCWKTATRLVNGWKDVHYTLPLCDLCQTSVGYTLEVATRTDAGLGQLKFYRIKCKCGRYVTRLP